MDEYTQTEKDKHLLLEVVEVLDIEDDLDTGMHRVNVCPSKSLRLDDILGGISG